MIDMYNCCAPFINHLPSSLNTRQRERQTGSAPISVDTITCDTTDRVEIY